MRLEISRRTDLATQALLVLGATDGRIKGPALAEAVGTTSGFLSQVLSPLVTRRWIRSDPGPTGGYSLSVALDRISVLEVLEAIEGPTDSGECVLEDRACTSTHPCALHVPWSKARAQLLAELAATPLSSLPAPSPTS